MKANMTGKPKVKSKLQTPQASKELSMNDAFAVLKDKFKL